MLDRFFLQVLDRSRIAGAVILAVLLARLLLKRAPKIISYALWAVVLFRLLCPVSVRAPVSIVPKITPAAQYYSLADEPVSLAGAGLAAYRAAGDALNGGLGIQYIRTTERDETGAIRYVTSNWWDVWILFGQYVWAAGAAAMLLYSVASYGRLRRKLQVAVPLRDNIYVADDIQSPFVMGLLRPRIYLPCGLREREQAYIILHEQHHVKRLDHICKALAFLTLCIYWFHPLVWLAFALAARDMEMSCDEAVLRRTGGGIRAAYAASLLTLATGRRSAGLPPAFGEGSVKKRIQNLERWRRPAPWTVAAAAAAGVMLTVCLAADPVGGIEKTREITGLVTELQTSAGGVTAVVIRTDGGALTGILLTAQTLVLPPQEGGGTVEEAGAASRAALLPGTTISADCTGGPKVLVTDDGTQITAYEARCIRAAGS